jgi:hypothetical protein
MTDSQRIFITFDEFFKISSKTFFEKEGFSVETEVEIFHLPKRLDVLIVKNADRSIPEDFTLFQYWKEFNLISFKSKPDTLEISDIWDSLIYFYGFINRNKESNFQNTTMSLLVNSHPRNFLKEYTDFCKELEPGVWEINSNFCKVYLIELHKINLKGMDRLYLGNFSTDKAFSNVLKEIENPNKDSKESKWIDSIKNIIYDRIAAFEKDQEIRRKYMATVYEADITDLVKPHLEKARLEGREEGFQSGELKTKLETARKMKEEGDSINKIIRITSLTMDQLKEHGILV